MSVPSEFLEGVIVLKKKNKNLLDKNRRNVLRNGSTAKMSWSSLVHIIKYIKNIFFYIIIRFLDAFQDWNIRSLT